MSKSNQRLLFSYATLAAIMLTVGFVVSLHNAADGTSGTWWLLCLSALAWGQAMLLRKEIRTSGVLLRLFNAVSWALLGFAGVSLFSAVPARVIGDVIVLVILAVAFVGPRLRRAR